MLSIACLSTFLICYLSDWALRHSQYRYTKKKALDLVSSALYLLLTLTTILIVINHSSDISFKLLDAPFPVEMEFVLASTIGFLLYSTIRCWQIRPRRKIDIVHHLIFGALMYVIIIMHETDIMLVPLFYLIQASGVTYHLMLSNNNIRFRKRYYFAHVITNIAFRLVLVLVLSGAWFFYESAYVSTATNILISTSIFLISMFSFYWSFLTLKGFYLYLRRYS